MEEARGVASTCSARTTERYASVPEHSRARRQPRRAAHSPLKTTHANPRPGSFAMADACSVGGGWGTDLRCTCRRPRC
eukprot:3675458-Rhodomonas_salina.1